MLKCLVTGSCGGGIGEAVLRNLASQGHAVCVHGRDASRVEGVRESLPQCSTPHASLTQDLAQLDELGGAVERLIAGWGGIDVLVLSAAPGFPPSRLHDLSFAHWRREIAEVLDAQFTLCKAVLPLMMERRFGRIVFLSSSAAQRGSFGRSAAYATGKAGVLGMSKQIALEYASYGITSNCIVPSQIDTPRIRANGRRTIESLDAHAKANVPVGRVGQPADIVAAVDFIVASGYFTGQEIIIDGGTSLAANSTKVLR